MLSQQKVTIISVQQRVMRHYVCSSVRAVDGKRGCTSVDPSREMGSRRNAVSLQRMCRYTDCRLAGSQKRHLNRKSRLTPGIHAGYVDIVFVFSVGREWSIAHQVAQHISAIISCGFHASSWRDCTQNNILHRVGVIMSHQGGRGRSGVTLTCQNAKTRLHVTPGDSMKAPNMIAVR